MTLTRIQNYNLTDVKVGMIYLLTKASADPEIRRLAIEITQHSQNKILSIYNWVKGNVPYTPDPNNIELMISPSRMADDYRAGKAIGGDCDDIALLTVSLLRSIGIKSDLVIIAQSNEFDHVYCQAHSEKLGVIPVDPSANVPLGWEPRYVKKIVV